MSVWDFVKRGVAGVNNERYTFDVNTGKVLWMLSALLGASLPITGYYIWIKHMVSKKQRRKIS